MFSSFPLVGNLLFAKGMWRSHNGGNGLERDSSFQPGYLFSYSEPSRKNTPVGYGSVLKKNQGKERNVHGSAHVE
ncbi:MAG TPA: hypothetical protein DCP92_16895 [Nitrospiraceae bacterium]|nr:hypothetical protein [Nitrospiraceae bacterium]